MVVLRLVVVGLRQLVTSGDPLGPIVPGYPVLTPHRVPGYPGYPGYPLPYKAVCTKVDPLLTLGRKVVGSAHMLTTRTGSGQNETHLTSFVCRN
eukprot:755712-Rhodomonas_salina.2